MYYVSWRSLHSSHCSQRGHGSTGRAGRPISWDPQESILALLRLGRAKALGRKTAWRALGNMAAATSKNWALYMYMKCVHHTNNYAVNAAQLCLQVICNNSIQHFYLDLGSHLYPVATSVDPKFRIYNFCNKFLPDTECCLFWSWLDCFLLPHTNRKWARLL